MKTSEQIVNEIINQDYVPIRNRKDIPEGGMNDFLSSIVKKFHDKQIDNFPSVCEECRIINIQHMKQLAEVGHKTPTRMVGGKVC